MHNNNLNIRLFWILLLCGFSIMVPICYGDCSLYYLVIVGINSFISLSYCFNDFTKPFALNTLINFFIYIFFILANAVQYAKRSVVLTFAYHFEDFDYFFFQCLIFIILLGYNLLHRFFYRQGTFEERPTSFSSRKVVFISCVATILVLIYFRFNFASLLFRGLTEDMLNEYGVQKTDETPVSALLVFDKIVRSMPWGCFILSNFIECPKKSKILLFLLTLLTVFPTGLARNAMAMYWIPIFLIVFGKFIKGNRFMYIMFCGIFLIFPFLDNFRHYSGEVSYNMSFDYLNTMNMDASQIFMATISVGIITYGAQLLGALFFFIPRSIWISKPVGSGHFLVTRMGGDFTNVSMPFFAEGYINFGFVGIILFTMGLAYLTGRLDGKFWTPNKNKRPQDGYYLILCGAIVFIMRGDLMSSGAYTIGTLLSYFLVLKLSRSNYINRR